MGTAIVVEVHDAGATDGAFDAAIEAAMDHLRRVDARFSTYKADSEVSRLNRGELTEQAAARSCAPSWRCARRHAP